MTVRVGTSETTQIEDGNLALTEWFRRLHGRRGRSDEVSALRRYPTRVCDKTFHGLVGSGGESLVRLQSYSLPYTGTWSWSGTWSLTGTDYPRRNVLPSSGGGLRVRSRGTSCLTPREDFCGGEGVGDGTVEEG